MTRYQPLKTIILIFGAFSFSFNLNNIIHEFGHAVADWASGIPASNIHIIIHPFFAPHMNIEGCIPDSLLGLPDAAGPLASVVFGLLVFALLWKIRKPYLLPFLFLGPLASVQEGMGLIVNVSQPGTDAARTIAAGFPVSLLITICVLLLVGGIILLTLLVPVTGIPTGYPFPKLFGTMVAGILPYGIITLIVSSLLSTNQADISRSWNIIFGFALIATLISTLYRLLGRIMQRISLCGDHLVNWSSSFIAVGLLIALVILELIFLN